MGHASDCAVHDGPAFLPGPCDCGLELSNDPFELFRPLAVIGRRRGRWEVRQRNVEAFIKTEQAPSGDGVRVRLTIDLPCVHGWPACLGVPDCEDANHAVAVQIVEREAGPALQGG